MIQLKVENFSCIGNATLDLGALNVLIGPQASGKSVISKLLYFFIDLFERQYESISKEKSFEDFSQELKIRFSEWFPISAWGQQKFKIEFGAGEYKLRLIRVTYGDSINDTLRLWTSPLVKSHYRETLEFYKSAKIKATRKNAARYASFELAYEVQRDSAKRLHAVLKEDYIEDQTFIPAGRSFFTSLGRAFMAFDQGRVLDPITIRFGRLYSSMQESAFLNDQGSPRSWESELAEILGGEVTWEGERASITCPDGRRIPFSSLSSGQQELLPLITVASLVTSYRHRGDHGSSLLYIEEPEAHLFPSAQSRLIQGLAGFASESEAARRLLLTTHSPYVLAKINNLIKAGQLELTLGESRQGALSRIIPKRARIGVGMTQAYAIVDGELRSIIDEEGLIAADYLDDISGQIGSEFSKLLELELEDDSR